MNNYVTLAVAIVSSSFLTAIASAFMNRRKYEIDNEDKLTQMAMRLANEFEKKYETVKAEYTAIKVGYTAIKEENRLLKIRVGTLENKLANQTQTATETPKNSSLRGLR